MRLANVSESELARQAGINSTSIGKLMKGQRSVKDETLLRLCDLMQTPGWLEERIMNAAGYSSREQRHFVEGETAILEAEQRVEEELERRTNQQ